jgi:hypothetical protein
MRIDTFNTDTGAVFDRELWNELCSLRFVDDARGELILGRSASAKPTSPPRWGTLRSAAAAA